MWSINRLFRRKKEVDRYEIVESFQNSFESDNTIDFVVDSADLAFDKFVDSDAVNGVPVVGMLNSVYKIYKNVQAYRLAKKIYRLLYHTREIKTEKKQKFVKEYIESNQEDGIDALLSVIDKLDNQHKVDIMAQLLKSKVEEDITINEFNRLVACLQRIPYSDVLKLKDYKDHYYEPGVTEVLYTAGVLYLSHEDFEENTNKYKLNYNGAQFLKYGLKEDVEIPADFKVKRKAVVIDSDIDEIKYNIIEEAKPKWESDILNHEAAQADIDEIFDRVDTLEDDQLSTEYDAENEKLILKKGKDRRNEISCDGITTCEEKLHKHEGDIII